jgi:type VI secretion system secreted protein Hcp
MASDYYLKIDGVKGESQAVDMDEYIELDGFSFGASNPADVGGKGLGSGKASLSDFSFSCGLDSSSAQILKCLYSGTHIPTVTFVGRKTGGDGKPYTYLKSTMTKCFITSHSTGGGSQGVPNQSVSIAYEQIEYEYNTQDTETGQMKNAGTATYNIGAVQAT